MVGSYPVLYVNLAAHDAQFTFLVLFENPHIERMYGKRKPLAMCRPLSVSEGKKSRARKVNDLGQILSSIEENADQLTVSTVTECESVTDTELETECEGETTPEDKRTHQSLRPRSSAAGNIRST